MGESRQFFPPQTPLYGSAIIAFRMPKPQGIGCFQVPEKNENGWRGKGPTQVCSSQDGLRHPMVAVSHGEDIKTTGLNTGQGEGQVVGLRAGIDKETDLEMGS